MIFIIALNIQCLSYDKEVLLLFQITTQTLKYSVLDYLTLRVAIKQVLELRKTSLIFPGIERFLKIITNQTTNKLS